MSLTEEVLERELYIYYDTNKLLLSSAPIHNYLLTYIIAIVSVSLTFSLIGMSISVPIVHDISNLTSLLIKQVGGAETPYTWVGYKCPA